MRYSRQLLPFLLSFFSYLCPMTASIRDVAYQLRQGKLIALADETGWSVAADPTNEAAVAQLLTLREFLSPQQQVTVLIQNADQLVMYVAKLPDVAYDLVEFAENPLTVVYDQGKNVAPVLLDGDQTLAVRRALADDVQRLIGSFGRAMLVLPLEALKLPAAVDALVTERFGTLPGMPKWGRIMRLGTNGDVSFIRK